jgi:hypothetical protein
MFQSCHVSHLNCVLCFPLPDSRRLTSGAYERRRGVTLLPPNKKPPPPQSPAFTQSTRNQIDMKHFVVCSGERFINYTHQCFVSKREMTKWRLDMTPRCNSENYHFFIITPTSGELLKKLEEICYVSAFIKAI